ncbi:hypothetical protein M3O96_15005 [Aquiflexum sp. TKW24L]|uniref:hypothetical protein n=1 Tax=Aquiflexum sp. TKW24L TaxID=2942212 RepID=UPI0020BED2B7|nr:hypothetical protein [Aquiflexum sp. TKW24L]MCL6260409.1 hypothetical protein [Aquiflexum sp. TKW24L]
MKTHKFLGFFLVVCNVFFAVQCLVPVLEYEHNVFITLEGRITDSSNQGISGLELILGQETLDGVFMKNDIGYEYDSLDNVVSRRIKLGRTDESGYFKFVVPGVIFKLLIYKNSETYFQYIDNGKIVERNYILFERDKITQRFPNRIKNIKIMNP